MPFDRAAFSSVSRAIAGIDQNSSEGQSKVLLIGARECLLDATILDLKVPNSTGEYILTFHAMELGLKAYLIKRGMSGTMLSRKPYGHNVVQLHLKAKSKGLILETIDAQDLLAWVNEWHSSGVKIRYEFAPRRLPVCNMLFPLAEEILSLAEEVNQA